MQRAIRPFEVMVKPIGPRCNLDCAYCYYLEKTRLYGETRKFGMSAEVLEAYVRDHVAAQVALGSSEIGFNWQGGEPTMLGVDFFRRAEELERKYVPRGVSVRNSLQTNGTLLDEEWGTFLRENDFLVGLSLDGPAALHDRYRVDRAGHPSHARVMAALELLHRHGVEFNTLTAVHRLNAKEPRAVYRHLKDVGSRYMQFIPIVERLAGDGVLAGPPQIDEDGAEYRVAPWSVLPQGYGEFLCGLFDEWIKEDVGRIFVQFFDVQLGLWMGEPPGLCWYSETCGGGLALEHNGDLYACDHYVYPEYRLGNILETPIEDLAHGPAQIKFGHDKATSLPRQCRECRFRFACHGGCPKHRFRKAADGEPGVSYFCNSHLRFFEHAGPRLKMMADLVRGGWPASDVMQLTRHGRAGGVRAKPSRNDPCPCGSGRKFKFCHGKDLL